MRESIKAICIVVFMVTCVWAAIVWTEVPPTQKIWITRITCTILALGSISLFLLLHFQKDKAPDYLKILFGNYCNREGFCFLIVPKVK